MTAPKNLPASVKARLLAVAQRRGESFNLLLLRFGVERLLYRLSQSRHADRFLLKGAMLFALWDEKAPRPTQDVDFLAFGPTELKDIEAAFREIVETPVPADGLVFKADSIRVENIREADAYGGVRVRLLAMLGKGELPLQVDLGSGDVVTPAAEKSVFPALLDFPAPQIRSYPIYTVVAEKFEAMVKLGITNSRMKDFFDVWFLSRRFDFDGVTLHKAIHATFARRLTALAPKGWLHARLSVQQPAAQGFGLAGSGVFVINPPHTLHAPLAASLPYLVNTLGQFAGANFLIDRVDA